MVELERGDMERFVNYDTGYKGKRKKGFRATFASWDKLLLILVVVSLLLAGAALFVLLTPVSNFILDFTGLHYAGWIEWSRWLMSGDRGLIIGVVLGLGALLFALLARYRVRRNFSVYAEAGCPQCHEHELIRVRRNRPDRVLGFLGVPARRYSCRNCTWHGVRLAGYKYGQKSDKIEDLEDGAFEFEDIEDGAFEDIAVNSYEFEGGPAALEIEAVDVAAPAEEMVTDRAVAVKAVVAEEITEDIVELDLIEPAVHTIEEGSVMEEAASEPALVGQSLAFADDFVDERAAEDDMQIPVVFAAEIVGDAEYDDEPSHEGVVVEPPLEENETYDELQPDVHEQRSGGEDRQTAEESDDDEFARLCLEVARSKK